MRYDWALLAILCSCVAFGFLSISWPWIARNQGLVVHEEHLESGGWYQPIGLSGVVFGSVAAVMSHSGLIGLLIVPVGFALSYLFAQVMRGPWIALAPFAAILSLGLGAAWMKLM